jgi:hypothetical protein
MKHIGIVRSDVLVARGGLPSFGFLEASSVLYWCTYGPADHGSPSVPFVCLLGLKLAKKKMLIFQTLVNVQNGKEYSKLRVNEVLEL